MLSWKTGILGSYAFAYAQNESGRLWHSHVRVDAHPFADDAIREAVEDVRRQIAKGE